MKLPFYKNVREINDNVKVVTIPKEVASRLEAGKTYLFEVDIPESETKPEVKNP